MKLIYPIIIIPTGKNDYYVKIPDIDIGTQGNSVEDAIYMARDAISLMIVEMQDEGEPIPPASDISTVKSEEEGAIITLVDCDIDAYRRMLEKRSVRKNVTIPGWLNDMAVKQHINFSEVLRNALMEQLNIDHP